MGFATQVISLLAAVVSLAAALVNVLPKVHEQRWKKAASANASSPFNP